jgi:hypothetical protein
MQVIADSSAGGRLGAALGTGLQQLAQSKLEHVKQQHARESYSKFFGPSATSLITNSPPEIQKVLLQNPIALRELGQLIDQQQAQSTQQQPEGGMQALQQQQPNFNAADFLTNQNVNPLMRQALSQSQISPEALIGLLGQQGQQQAEQPGQQGQGNFQAQSNAQPSNFEAEKSRLLGEAFTSPHARIEQEKLNIQKEAHELKGNKDVRDYLAPYHKQVQASEDNIRDYKLLENLARKGNLRSGTTYQLLSKLGLEDFGLNYSSQLANKLIGRLAQNAQSAFGPGTRVTNYLERVFQRSLPSLWNTPEGIIGISKLNSLADQANIEEYELRDRIINENKGKVPGNIEGQARERMKPIRERLENEAMDIITGLDTAKRGNELRPKGYKGRVLDNVTGKIIEV